jgi:hypothetical protein
MAFLAQRFLRHKSLKPSFQAYYWLTALIHQAVALGYITDGSFRWRGGGVCGALFSLSQSNADPRFGRS